jgi:hypothetical protein
MFQHFCRSHCYPCQAGGAHQTIFYTSIYCASDSIHLWFKETVSQDLIGKLVVWFISVVGAKTDKRLIFC